MISLVNITDGFVADNIFLLKIKSNFQLYENQDFCKTVAQKKKEKRLIHVNTSTPFYAQTAGIACCKISKNRL